MFFIILRILLFLILVINLLIMICSVLINENIYKKYGMQILKGIGAFILIVLALYTTLILIGVSI